MDIRNSFSELVGNTPILRMRNVEAALQLRGALLAKIEGMNPAGSVKDRAARQMIEDAESSGRLKRGGTIVEPTSGNTGIGLAAVAASKGYRVVLTMPDTMSAERRALLAAYGATLVLTDGKLGMKGAIERAEALARETPGAILAGQFVNPANPAAHYATTGPEILRQTDGELHAFVAGVGTGGTLSGTGRFLKEHIPGIRVVAVEPADSPVLSGGQAGAHGLQGIGAGFVPEALDTAVYDEVIRATTEDARRLARLAARREGILSGISAGAALWAASQLLLRDEFAGKRVLTILPDIGDRYLSTGLFDGDPEA